MCRPIPVKVLLEIKRVLKRSGSLILTTPNVALPQLREGANRVMSVERRLLSGQRKAAVAV